MGKMTALSLLCLAVSIFSCAILETETLPSDERLKREENIFEVNQQSEDHSAHEVSARSQRKKSTTTFEQLADEVEQLRRSQRSLEDWRTNLLKEKLRTKRDSSTGSTFVRWGRKSCPSGTSEVYVGAVGGKLYRDKGSGTNYLCMTRSPKHSRVYLPPNTHRGAVYGAEYEGISSHQDHDVPCSVCLAPKSTTMMVPGTDSCPSGWTRQYYGYLASAYFDHFATEFVCLDKYPEHDDSGRTDLEAALFSFVISRCGALPCPPYRQNEVITCAVCSK